MSEDEDLLEECSDLDKIVFDSTSEGGEGEVGDAQAAMLLLSDTVSPPSISDDDGEGERNIMQRTWHYMESAEFQFHQKLHLLGVEQTRLCESIDKLEQIEKEVRKRVDALEQREKEVRARVDELEEKDADLRTSVEQKEEQFRALIEQQEARLASFFEREETEKTVVVSHSEETNKPTGKLRACTNCRDAHLGCNRKWPTCARCQKKGLKATCRYVQRTNKKESAQPWRRRRTLRFDGT